VAAPRIRCQKLADQYEYDSMTRLRRGMPRMSYWLGFFRRIPRPISCHIFIAYSSVFFRPSVLRRNSLARSRSFAGVQARNIFIFHYLRTLSRLGLEFRQMMRTCDEYNLGSGQLH